MSETLHDPLVFEPYLRQQVWGGRRLESLFGKRLPDGRAYGESWEISAHPHHVSQVAEGSHSGALLTDLCQRFPDQLFGKRRPAGDQFPLLIKLLDCQELLSIQVHPDDATASRLLPGERGKTEAWIVLDVAPGGKIFAGLKEAVSREGLQGHLQAGTTDRCMHVLEPKVGDCLFIDAGTVHAVGNGVVIAEVQQSSDATFRLFDWNRLGDDGLPRKLHIAESLASIDFSAGPLVPVTPKPLADLPVGVAGEMLVRCPHFGMDRYRLDQELVIPYAEQPSIWMVLDGEAQLVGIGPDRQFGRGQTVLVPAVAPRGSWRPSQSGQAATLLGVTF